MIDEIFQITNINLSKSITTHTLFVSKYCKRGKKRKKKTQKFIDLLVQILSYLVVK